MPQNEVTEAVRSLRKRLGDTQQQFANRLGMAISTVVRYELSRPPRGKVLRTLEALAVNSAGFREAAIFRNAFFDEFQPGVFQYLRLTPRNEREEELVQALLWAARTSEDEAALQKIEEHLKSYSLVKAQFETAINDAADQFLLVEAYAADGLPPEAIAEESSVTVERVRLWLTVRDALDADVPSLRMLLQSIGLGDPEAGLAASFQVPVSMVKALKKVFSDFGIPILNTDRHAVTQEKQHKQQKRC
ncbi:hypothetical protein SBA4_1090008 [Candidatus Sulfopaludibacter sp. SbA4]|nr:hypothetical protein SBA4_1090008 [Candidatus Sulfopaludibacter sp. SbA4]